nr:hypothetical protein [uncultured Duganella sp.]
MIRAALAILAALLLAGPAAACSCPFIEPAGFVHASLKHLPANALGALFLTPQGNPAPDVKEADFVITSDQQAGKLKVALSYPDMLTNRPHMHGQRLVRVGPADGFKAGAHYTIRYVGKVGQWHYPTEVKFIIDTNTINVKLLSYRLRLDAPPSRQLLTMADGRGSCASNQPVIVENFSYITPDSLRPYQQAITYFSQVGTAGNFKNREFLDALCSAPAFGVTAYGKEQDLVQVDCNAPGAATAIRGQAGFLEIEDRLQTTAPVSIDLRQAVGKACFGMGMLKEALARGDRRQALDLVCKLAQEATYDGPFVPYAERRKIPAATPPSTEALAQLAQHADEKQRLCIAKIGRGL